MNDRDFLAIFLEEASEILSRWENICLTMENIPSENSINALFGAVNTLKEGSFSVGLKEFGTFLQQIEETILFLKKNPSSAKPAVLAVFLDCQTILVDWVKTLHTDQGYKPHTSSISQKLKKAIESAAAPITSKEAVKENSDHQQEISVGDPREEDQPELPTITETAQPPTTLGDILVEKGHVTHEQLDDALTLQNAKLGSILVAQGAASKEAVKEALDIQSQRGISADDSIRVSLRKLNELMKLVGDLSIQQSIIAAARTSGDIGNASTDEAFRLSSAIIKDLQHQTLSLRTRSAQSLLLRLEKDAKEFAKSRGTKLKIKTYGEEVEIEKQVFEQTKNLLSNLVKNIIAVGIESTGELKPSSKPFIPTIMIDISQATYSTKIQISLDRPTISIESITEYAISNKITIGSQSTRMDDALHCMLLKPNSRGDETPQMADHSAELYTARSSLQQINATLQIGRSQEYPVMFTFEIPRTPCLIDAVIVSIAGSNYAVPLTEIAEVVDTASIHKNSESLHSRLVNIRGKIIPLEDLSIHLPATESQIQRESSSLAIITKNGDSEIAFLIDRIIGQQTIVVKGIDTSIEPMPGLSGATILANGTPAMILQPSMILGAMHRKAG